MGANGKKRVIVSWSTGKDSAWSLHVLRQRGDCTIVGLLTTINEQFDRVAMHAVRRELLQAQAEAAGVPLWPVPIPWPCPNTEYEHRLAEACARARHEGVDAVAFGDLYLADIHAYRERQLAGTGLEPLFPLWGLPTAALARAMIAGGLRAKVSCVDPKHLPREFAGRDYDESLLAALPAGVDPCAESGEFHTFCYAGPMFRAAIPVVVGETVERDGFVFADLVLSRESRGG